VKKPERRFRTFVYLLRPLEPEARQADRVLYFLKSTTGRQKPSNLVGVRRWLGRLKSNWYWPHRHNYFVQKMLRRCAQAPRSSMACRWQSRHFLRNITDLISAASTWVENTIHEGVDGKRYLNHPRRISSTSG